MSSNAALWQGQSTLIPVVNAAGNILEEWQIATAAQTVFVLASYQYTPGTRSINVYRNGLILRRGFDYIETSSTTITLTTPSTLNDRLDFVAVAITVAVGYNGGGVPAGGTSGQALVKINGSDYNTQWVSLTALASLLDAPLQTVASANTVDLSSYVAVTRNLAISGSVSIAGFQVPNGELYAIRFTGSPLLVNSASLVTNKGVNIQAAPGDTCFLRATADNVVEILSYVGAGTLTSAQNYTFRNRLINGAPAIDQRAAGIITSGYLNDRWKGTNSAAVVNYRTVTGTTLPDFTTAIRITSLAATVAAAGSYWIFQQMIEGNNVQDLAYGSANAKTCTLSFWVRSSVIGTFSAFLQNSGSSRSYVATYTVNVANTWEYKTLVIPGDTAGVWLADTGVGVAVGFCVGIGTTFATAPGGWTAGNFVGATGQTSVAATNGATIDFAGIQFERGTIATAFERLDYPTELKRCERYYERGTQYLRGYLNAAAQDMSQTAVWRSTKRVVPTVGYSPVTTANVSTFDLRDPTIYSGRWYAAATAAGVAVWDGTWTADADF